LFDLIALTPLKCVELDMRSALVYQQAMLIKLNETRSQHEPTMTTQGPETGNRLVLTKEIKVLYFNLL
jgi:hypothetical protein